MFNLLKTYNSEVHLGQFYICRASYCDRHYCDHPTHHNINLQIQFSQEDRKSSFAETFKRCCESILPSHFKGLRYSSYLSRDLSFQINKAKRGRTILAFTYVHVYWDGIVLTTASVCYFSNVLCMTAYNLYAFLFSRK